MTEQTSIVFYYYYYYKDVRILESTKDLLMSLCNVQCGIVQIGDLI